MENGQTKKKDMNTFKIILLTIALSFAFISCDEDSDFDGADNYITSFALQQGETKYQATITKDSIIFYIPNGVTLSDIKPEFTISENSKISPDPASISDWNNNMEFTIEAHNGAKKMYRYAVKKRAIVQDGNITLLTQADVNEFAKLNISTVNGCLYIAAVATEDTIKSLSALSNLKSVKYELNIGPKFWGKNLDGLQNLENVADIIIGTTYSAKMPALKEIKLSSLKSVNGDFSIVASSAKIVEAPLLKTIGGNLKLESDSLQTLNISALESVGLEFKIMRPKKMQKVSVPELKKTGNINFTTMPELIEIDLPKLEDATSSFNINAAKIEKVNTPNLTHAGTLVFGSTTDKLNANFKSLKQVDNQIELSSVKGKVDLSALTTVGGRLQTPQTNDFTIFKSLKSVGEILYIYPTTDCISLAGFENLTSVLSMQIYPLSGEAPLTDLSGLRSLTTVKEKLEIQGFPNLTSLKDLKSLISVGSSLELRNVGITRLSSTTLPPKLTSIGLIAITQLPLQELDIRGLSISKISLSYMSSKTDKTKVIGDGKVMEQVYIEDCKKVDFVGVEEVSYFYMSPNGTRGYGIEISGIRKAGSANVNHGRDYLIMHNLEEVTGDVQISNIVTFPDLKTAGSITCNSTWGSTLSELTTVNGDFMLSTGSGASGTSVINLPKLRTIKGKLTIRGSSKNTTLLNLDGLSSLTKVNSVMITNNSNLSNFSGLKNAISSLPSGIDWTASGNAYNPTYQDMKDGKYIP